jgi:hypothetical protein
LQGILAVDHDQVVTAIGEERVVLVGKPRQERLALGDLVSGHRRRPRVDLLDDG